MGLDVGIADGIIKEAILFIHVFWLIVGIFSLYLINFWLRLIKDQPVDDQSDIYTLKIEREQIHNMIVLTIITLPVIFIAIPAVLAAFKSSLASLPFYEGGSYQRLEPTPPPTVFYWIEFANNISSTLSILLILLTLVVIIPKGKYESKNMWYICGALSILSFICLQIYLSKISLGNRFIISYTLNVPGAMYEYSKFKVVTQSTLPLYAFILVAALTVPTMIVTFMLRFFKKHKFKTA